MAQPGDTVYVLAGIYRERVSPPRGGEAGKPIVYYGEPGKRVYIKGSDVYDGEWEKASDSIFVANLNLMEFTDDCYVDNANPFKVKFILDTPGNMAGATLGQVFVKSKPYQQVTSKSKMTAMAGSWWYEATTNKVYVHFRQQHSPNNTVEFTTRRRVFAPHATQMGLGYINVENFIIEHCGNQFPKWERETMQAGALGLQSGHHWVVRNNVVRYAANAGVDCGFLHNTNERNLQSDWGWPAPGVTGNLIENNYFIDNGSVGITGTGTYQMICRNNVVMWNHTQGIPMENAEQAGLKFHGCKNGDISGNYVVDNFAFGIWLDNQYPRTRVARNIFTGNYNRGVSVEMGEYQFGEGAMIDHNVIMDNHPDMQLDIMDASGCLVVNNLIAGDKRGALVTQIYGGVDRRSDNNAFYNNIFCNHTESDISVPYPVAQAGEQRFLGNLYDVTDRKMYINNHTDQWQTSPLTDSQFFSSVAEDAGTSVAALQAANALDYAKSQSVKLNLTEWQHFWAAHTSTEHYDSDAQVMPGITAEYLPETQSVKLHLPQAVNKRLNNRWDTPYKTIYGLTEDSSYPGPFDNLQAGDNVVKFYTGSLPILERGKLPGPDDEEPDMPYEKTQTGVEAIKATPIKIFPNPVRDILTIEHAKERHLIIYSVSGQTIFEKNRLQDTENISVAGWYPGIYLIKLQSEIGFEETSLKIIKI
ncbi:hypothetical protein AGMMS49965_00550 [Bacteroidia bacterium]|nr:hypothetical protein AGMMS49965_00550 [Bacteroidia bacterium]